MASAIPGSGILAGLATQQKGAFAHFYSGSSPGKEPSHRNVSRPEDTDIPSPDTEKIIVYEDETIMNTASQLADDFIGYKTDITRAKPSSKYAETLRRVGDEIDVKYNISLKGITDRLQFSPEKHGYDAYRACLDSMFDEGQVNWGRIATVYVFSARLAKHCKESDLVEYVEDIKDYTAKYVRCRLGKWIKQQGGWDAMNEAFKETDWKDKVAFNGLLMTGAVLTGLAALRLLMGK
ncbi:apoptosis regulator BAX-like [Glandiceps talaboti]